MLNPRLRRSPQSLLAKFRAGRPFHHLAVEQLLTAPALMPLARELGRLKDSDFTIGHDDIAKLQVCRDIATLGPAFRRLNDFLSSEEFLHWVSDVTGVPALRRNPNVECGGLFRYYDEFERDPHLDANDTDLNCAQIGHRRKIHMLLYLNPEWDAAWGGALELYRRPDGDPVSTYAPLMNRCVFIDVRNGSWHGVNRVALPPEKRRLMRTALIVNYYSTSKVGTRREPMRCNTWMPKPLPKKIRAGRTATMGDLLEAARLLHRRDARLNVLVQLERTARAVKAGRKADKIDPMVGIPAASRSIDELSRYLQPGRVLTQRDVASLRKPFRRRDRELQRLYARQCVYIEELKASAPDLLPRTMRGY